MRFIIYGAGGIGCVIGGHLARTGHDVVLIGRPGHMEQINDHGLRLVTPSGTHILRIPAVTSPHQIAFLSRTQIWDAAAKEVRMHFCTLTAPLQSPIMKNWSLAP